MSAHLPKSVEIIISGIKYTVNFPNTGQYMDIMNTKNRLMSNLVQTDAYSVYAAILSEMIAVYSIMIPALKKDLNVDSIYDLDMIQSKELVDSYTTVYQSFFDNWMNLLTKPKEEKK